VYERLKKIREHFKKSQSEFAKSLGMGQSTLGMLEVGKRDILDRHIKTVCSIYNVSENWLRTGEGEMLKDYYEEGELEYLVTALDAKEDEFKINFIKFMLRQPDERWNMFEQMIKEYNDFSKKK
jgi:transcriptional regulator with XRE-family HTH domain